MGRSKKINTQEFIEKAKNIHGDKYDYSKVEYINSMTKVVIGCSIHGLFEQSPLYHTYNKRGCFLCGIAQVVSGITLTKEQFVKKANIAHSNKYDYSMTVYKNMHTKITIICKKCKNNFIQEPNNHVKEKNGCPKCNGGKKLTTEEFIKKAKKIHSTINYDYILVEYKNTKDPVKIICPNPKHGIFLQSPTTHLSGGGCQKCKSSRGEERIMNFLKKHKINFLIQKKFTNCKSKRFLPFDFYLPEKNICIEFDGIQHFYPIKKFGGEEGLIERQKSDKIKDDFCKKESIKLIRVSYKEKIIQKLTQELLK